MKRFDSKTLYLVGLFLLSGSVTALANEESSDDEAESQTTSKLRAGVFLGANYLSSDNELGNSFFNDQVPGSGFLLGLRGSYLLLDSISPDSELNPQLHIELEGKYTFSSTQGGVNGRDAVDSPVVGWRTHLLLELFPSHKLVPHVMLGFGGETVFGPNTYMTTPDTDISSYTGGGFRYPITGALDFRGDIRLGLTASRGDYFAGLAEIHLGVSYRFDTSNESESEEVEDDDEQETPATALPDSDGDGIADVDDSCPDMAEILNGIDDTDGCPETDSDNDGLLGSKDQCPDAAEDMDGYQDLDGCPDADNDGDGFPDIVDQCPGKAETKNGFKDEDGCPDEVPAGVQKFTGSIQGIVFKSGSARILRKSKSTLIEAYEVLADNPSVRIEISGHTDNKGKAENNRTLSRKRADYVKWFLVDRGIAADRIETVGHGPDKPLGDNNTNEGRQTNRRIEFRLLPNASSGPSTTTDIGNTKATPAAPVTSPKKRKKRNKKRKRSRKQRSKAAKSKELGKAPAAKAGKAGKAPAAKAAKAPKAPKK